MGLFYCQSSITSLLLRLFSRLNPSVREIGIDLHLDGFNQVFTHQLAIAVDQKALIARQILGLIGAIHLRQAVPRYTRQVVMHRVIIEIVNDQMALDLLSTYLRMDLSEYDPHAPLPPLPDEHDFDGLRTALSIIRGYDKKLTVLELGRLLLQSSDSWLVLGTAEEVADKLTEAFHAGAVDGYNLMFPFLPVDLDNFIEQVAPLLKARGVMKQAYQPGTLREKLGLPPVVNQFAKPQ